MANQENQTKESNKQLAMDQKSALQDLVKSKNRPNPFADLGCDIYVLPKEVIDKWRAFIK